MYALVTMTSNISGVRKQVPQFALWWCSLFTVHCSTAALPIDSRAFRCCTGSKPRSRRRNADGFQHLFDQLFSPRAVDHCGVPHHLGRFTGDSIDARHGARSATDTHSPPFARFWCLYPGVHRLRALVRSRVFGFENIVPRRAVTAESTEAALEENSCTGYFLVAHDVWDIRPIYHTRVPRCLLVFFRSGVDADDKTWKSRWQASPMRQYGTAKQCLLRCCIAVDARG